MEESQADGKPRRQPHSLEKNVASQLRIVRAAAERGAASVSVNRQIVSDAIEKTVAQWQSACLKGLVVTTLDAWAYRVAANAAKSLGARSALLTCVDPICELAAMCGDADALGPTARAGSRRLLKAHLVRHKKNLRGRQFEVLSMLCKPGMTLHLAAKSLSMDRRSLRRSFRSGLARLMSD